MDFPCPKAEDVLGHTSNSDSKTGGRKQEVRRRERMRRTLNQQIKTSGPWYLGMGYMRGVQGWKRVRPRMGSLKSEQEQLAKGRNPS